MKNYKFIYGPIPSRRLGKSLGVSPIPKKACNYACIYCQLGQTQHMTNRRQMFFEVEEILKEVEAVLQTDIDFDVITVVGEGEPTLYLGLEDLLKGIKAMTDKPLAVITNSGLMYLPEVRQALMSADIVLPSIDGYKAENFKKINRPYGKINFSEMAEGLNIFSKAYPGQLWAEIMLMKGINDSEDDFEAYKQVLEQLRYDRLYLNTPIRPPAEQSVEVISDEAMEKAVDKLGGIAINLMATNGFYSEIEDDYQAILSIIKRHPMNQFELNHFLESRGCQTQANLICQLEADPQIQTIVYKGYRTYRLR